MARMTNAMRKTEMLRDAAARCSNNAVTALDLARTTPARTLETIPASEFGPVLNALLLRRANHATTNIAAWVEKLTNPCHAFSWSDEMFMEAAWGEVTTRIAESVMHDTTKYLTLSAAQLIAAVRVHITYETVKRTTQLSASTSPTRNLMDNCLRVAWAAMADETGFVSFAFSNVVEHAFTKIQEN